MPHSKKPSHNLIAIFLITIALAFIIATWFAIPLGKMFGVIEAGRSVATDRTGAANYVQISITDRGIGSNDILVIVEQLPEAIPFSPEGGLKPDFNFGNKTLVWFFSKTPQKLGTISIDKPPQSFSYILGANIPEIPQADAVFEGGWALKTGDAGAVIDKNMPLKPAEEALTQETVPVYAYDDSGNLVKIEYGKQTDGLESIYYAYDQHGNLIEEIKAIRMGGKKFFYPVIYEYDTKGNLVSFSSQESTVEYTYDAEGRITKETENGAVTTYDYDQEGNIVCVNCQPEATGIPESYAYDSNGSVAEYSIGSTTIQQEFDSSGRLVGVTDASGGSAAYSYDENSTLVSIHDSGFFGQSYTFNKCGTTDNYEYDENCNLLKDDTYSYEYNTDGLLSGKTTLATGEKATYNYKEGELESISYSVGSSDRYFYDSAGLFKIIDRYGNIQYRSPNGDIVTEEEFLKLMGDENGDKAVDSKDFFLSVEAGSRARIMAVVYNWIGMNWRKQPKISMDLVHPTAAKVDVPQGQFFNVTVNVGCRDGDCGEIKVSLDPASTITLTGESIAEDGNMWYNVPEESYSRENTGEMIVTGAGFPGIKRGYIEFNTASIPKGATINSVTLSAKVEWSGYGGADIYQMKARPKASEDKAVYEEIGKHAKYSSLNWDMCPEAGPPCSLWVNADLGDAAVNDMQEKLSSGWFALGFKEQEATEEMIIIKSAESMEKPRLIVTYTPPKGLVPAILGARPFYTNESNPRTITLNRGENQILTFWVNSTDEKGLLYTFYVYANRTANMAYGWNQTQKWRVRIV